MSKKYFSELVKFGGEVRVFRELSHFFEILTNHERDHRKLLLIDHKISYIGSANISQSHYDWRECVLRIEGFITKSFEHYFVHNWDSYDRVNKNKIKYVLHKCYEIVDDFPSKFRSPSKRKYLVLINNAKNSILIETAYFIPPKKIRRALYKAVKRGVDVKVVIPFVSDVWLVDYIRNLYLEKLYKKGIELFYYKPKIMHSKVMVVDDCFIIGSSNLTYRTFVYNYEINLFGKNKIIAYELKKHINETLRNSEPFVYEKWKKRSIFKKIAEKLLSIFERLT